MKNRIKKIGFNRHDVHPYSLSDRDSSDLSVDVVIRAAQIEHVPVRFNQNGRLFRVRIEEEI